MVKTKKNQNQQIIFLFYLYFFLLISSIQTKYQIKFECGVDFIKNIPKVDKGENLINNEDQINKNRRLSPKVDADGFKELDIYLDLSYFDSQIVENNLVTKRNFYINCITKAANSIISLLRVKPLTGEHYIQNIDFINANVQSWNKELFGDTTMLTGKGLVYNGIDLVICVVLSTSDELGGNYQVMGQAKKIVESTGQPFFGVLYINKENNIDNINYQQMFVFSLIHEFTHILGFEKNFLINYVKNVYEETDINGIKRYYINSNKVLEVAKKYFNCDSIRGIPLEDYGSGDGSEMSSHWDAKVLLGDYMLATFYSPEQVISEFTLALLEDTGYYKANYYTGGLMNYGKHKGCEFLNQKCVINQAINSKFLNEYFEASNENNPSCSSGRQSKTYNLLETQQIPAAYQYYLDTSKGGLAYSDYCPVFREYTKLHNLNQYYVGHCSYGSQQYVSQFSTVVKFTSGQLLSKTGETWSNSSFCVLSSLISHNVSDYDSYSQSARSVCYRMHCSLRSLTIQINNDYFVCPRAGGKIKGIDYSGYLLCPDYNLICSGEVLCNNMFDCIDKKSEIKEGSYIYDYEIKTSQDLSKAAIEEYSTENYELSTNGQCPKNCKQCTKNRLYMKCLECRENFKLLGSTETSEVKCVSPTDLSIGYYNISGVYYKCMRNCDYCLNQTTCNNCSAGYYLKRSICYSEDDSVDYTATNTAYRALVLVIITAVIFLFGLIIVSSILKKEQRPIISQRSTMTSKPKLETSIKV